MITKRQEKISFWDSHIKTCESSGLNMKQYCKKYNLSYSQFKNWKYKLASNKKKPSNRDKEINFTQLTLHKPPASIAGSCSTWSGIELMFNTIKLRIYPDFDETSLQRLLQILGNKPC